MLREFVLGRRRILRGFWPEHRARSLQRARYRERPARPFAGTAAPCSTFSPVRRGTCSTTGSKATWSRRCSASTPLSATMPAPTPPGSAYVMLHHAFGEVNGKKGVWGHAIGGMGAITPGDGAPPRARRRDRDRRRRARGDGRARPRGASCSKTARPSALNTSRPTSIQSCSTRGCCRRPRCRAVSRPHADLAQRLRHLPDECRAVRAAQFTALPGDRRPSHRRDHHGPSLGYMDRA